MNQDLETVRRYYVPANALKIAAKDSTAVAYVFEDRRGKPCATMFCGRQKRSTYSYAFKDEKQRETYVRDFFTRIASSEKYRANQKAEYKAKANAAPSVKIGDIFVCSWGYEQTNVDFYQVVGMRGAKTVTLRKIAGERNYTGSMQGTITPIKDSFTGEAFDKRVKGAHNTIKMTDYSTAFLWEGRAHYFSEYA